MKFTGPTSKTKGNNVNVIKKNKSFYPNSSSFPFQFSNSILKKKTDMHYLQWNESLEPASDNVVLKRLMDQIDIDLEGVNRIPAQTNEDIIR